VRSPRIRRIATPILRHHRFQGGPIVDKLNAELRRAITVPEVKGKLEGMGADARATSPAEMRALVASQFATWTRLAKEASISID
jgi:tripartite-type tricarboxylate transporter receptor subunit TctC